MYVDTETNLTEIAIHYVGNKQQEEGYILSKSSTRINEEMNEFLCNYFLTSFKSAIYYNFFNDDGLEYNTVYQAITRIFENPSSLFEESVDLAKYLYEITLHPQIKSGEFYVVFFDHCTYEGEDVKAIGLFKTENKDTFLKIRTNDAGFTMEREQGINTNKLDKGCLIFNVKKEDGYIVSIVDQTNRGTDARYWTDSFLQLRQQQDDYYNTQNVLNFCKSYITKELPENFEVNKADQVDLLNRSVQFFKENDEFTLNDFAEEVIEQPEVIRNFNQYRETFQQEQDVQLADQFTISENAVKKQSRVFKSVIKLDKNFHIYVHGNRELIEQGIDENGRKYYRIFYQEEN